jgi:hypothetical protein
LLRKDSACGGPIGIGDWLIASAQARYRYKQNGRKCVYIDPIKKETYWSEVFANNPYIDRFPVEGEHYNLIPNHPANRPYIGEALPDRIIWNRDFKAVPGDIFLSEEESAWTPVEKPYVLIEPNVKQKWLFSENKNWGFEKWQMLVDRNPQIPWVQPVYEDARRLRGVREVRTDHYRKGFALLAKSSLFIGTDGGLHHAAAALKVPAIVIWGHFTSPRMLGYEEQTNIWKGLGPCGSLNLCKECKRVMKMISVADVESRLRSALSRLSIEEGSSLKPSLKDLEQRPSL